MRNVNTMSNREFLILNIVYSLVLMFAYRTICFKNIYGISYIWSKVFLWSLLAIFVVLGIVVSYGKRRNLLSVVLTVLPAYEVYTLMAYMPYLRKLFVVLIALACGISAFFAAYVFRQKITDSKGIATAPKKYFIHGILGVRTIATLCLAAALAYVASSNIMGNYLLHSSIRFETSLYSEENTVANNIETVCQFRDDIWDTLDIDERLNALQIIANIERNYLGLSTPLTVEAGILIEGRLGQYDDLTYRIVVDADYLLHGSATGLLNALCHEAFHAYEYRLADAYDSLDDSSKALRLFSDIIEYKEELAMRLDSSDYLTYYYQLTEIDARDYAARATGKYLTLIDEYVANMQPLQ